MSLTSDLQLDAAKLRPDAISGKTREFNDKLIKIMKGGPKWYEVCMQNPNVEIPKVDIVYDRKCNFSTPCTEWTVLLEHTLLFEA